MSRDTAYLVDIREAASLALEYVRDKSLPEFESDLQCQDAVIRRLEIIGEASRRLSVTTRDAIPKVAWQSIVAMRNVLVHEYDAVDMRIVWETVQRDLPDLLSAIEPLITGEERG
jgi:uncharacterized protein with HEPN domain